MTQERLVFQAVKHVSGLAMQERITVGPFASERALYRGMEKLEKLGFSCDFETELLSVKEILAEYMLDSTPTV